MSDTRISAADLLRLASIASVSPEGSADEIMAIMQRTSPIEEPQAADEPAGEADGAGKLARPE